jgi:hypothetical protein
MRTSDSVISQPKVWLRNAEVQLYRAEKSNFPSMGFSGATLLAVIPVPQFIIAGVSYALPIRAKYTIPGVHLCYAIALAVSAVYVLTTPPSPVGHLGYFTHKQELGLFGAVGIILSSHELLHRGWRRSLLLSQ